MEKKLADNAIDHVSWEEPDYDMGFTAIATVPLTGEQKLPLANYRLWKPICSCILAKVSGESRKTDGRTIPAAPIYASSSEKERFSALKAEKRSDVQVIPGVPPSLCASSLEA